MNASVKIIKIPNNFLMGPGSQALTCPSFGAVMPWDSHENSREEIALEA